MKQIILILVLGVLVCENSAVGQQSELARDTGEFLMPPAKNYSYEKAAYYGYSKQLQNDMRTGMFKVLEVIHQTPILNPPRGWAVGASAVLSGSGPDGRRRLVGSSSIIFKGYYRDLKTRKVSREVEGPSLNVHFNDLDVIINQNELDDDFYFEEPLITRYMQGFPVYKKFVVITKNKAPLFVPVSREVYLQQQIAVTKARVDEEKKNLAEGSPYQRWLKDKKERTEEFMSGLKYTEQENPAKAKADKEKFLREMQRLDSLNKSFDPPYLKEVQKTYDRWNAELGKLEQQLARLSPQERGDQATSINNRPMVRINRAFFDPKKTMSAIQLVVIDLYKYVPGLIIYEQLFDAEKKALFKHLQDNLDLIKIQAALP